ncbi:hypothetical protein ACIQD3_06420 [Peribacillus loiseleuriae]|uniref:hypothetical protein n=1 Tax=Peribacillus loiseleuriae TaxID=1679170 RepID=UPI003825976B
MIAILRNVAKWSSIQLGVLVLSMIGFLTSMALFVFLFILFKSPNYGAYVENLFLTSIILVTIFVYALAWYYFFYSEYKDGNDTIRASFYSLIPNFFFLLPVLPTMFLPIEPYSCSFIPGRLVFCCLAFSIILLPIYSYLLQKWVFPVQNRKDRNRRLLFVWSSLLTGIIGVVVILSLFFDVWSFVMEM